MRGNEWWLNYKKKGGIKRVILNLLLIRGYSLGGIYCKEKCGSERTKTFSIGCCKYIHIYIYI